MLFLEIAQLDDSPIEGDQLPFREWMPKGRALV